MKLSLSTFLYLNYSLETAIRQIAIAGFDAIDVWGGRPHAYRNDLREHEIRRLRRLLDDLGMEMAAFIPAQIQYPSILCSPIMHIRMESVRYINTSIETAARLGAHIVSVRPGHTLHEQDLDDGWNRLADSLERICEFAASYDLLIAIEPADEYQTDLINTGIQAMDMIDQLDCDNLGVQFNTGHAQLMGEDTPLVIQHLADRLFHIQINDNNGVRDQRLIPGEGKYDYQQLKFALQKVPYDGFLAGDLGWDYTLNPDPAAVKTLEFLENLIHN
jgi:fructoselysine 3-epimerase